MVENKDGAVDEKILEGLAAFKEMVTPMTPAERALEAAATAGGMQMAREILRFVGIVGLASSSEETKDVLMMLGRSILALYNTSAEAAKILQELDADANH